MHSLPPGPHSLFGEKQGKRRCGGHGRDRTVSESRGLGRGTAQEQDTRAAHWDSLGPQVLYWISSPPPYPHPFPKLSFCPQLYPLQVSPLPHRDGRPCLGRWRALCVRQEARPCRPSHLTAPSLWPRQILCCLSQAITGLNLLAAPLVVKTLSLATHTV